MKAHRSRSPLTKSRRKPRHGAKTRAYEDRRIRWASLARSLEGRFVQAEKRSFDAIYVPHRDWRIKADTYLVSNGNQAVTYTRVRAFFVAQDGFRVRVSPANPWTRFLERVGLKDVRIGDPRLDKRYVIKGPDEGRIRSFFLDGRLRAVLGDQRRCHLEVKDLSWRERRDWDPGVREVFIRMKGEFIESARLRDLIRLCMSTLDRLSSSGAASIKAPTRIHLDIPVSLEGARQTKRAQRSPKRASATTLSVPRRSRRS